MLWSMDYTSCRSHNFCTAIFIIDDIHTVPVWWLCEKPFNSNITVNISTLMKRQVIQHNAGYDHNRYYQVKYEQRKPLSRCCEEWNPFHFHPSMMCIRHKWIFQSWGVSPWLWDGCDWRGCPNWGGFQNKQKSGGGSDGTHAAIKYII